MAVKLKNTLLAVEEVYLPTPMSLIDVCYFICSDCKTILPVPERVLESDGYFFNCNFCSRPVSLRNIYKNTEMEIIEAFGCNYGGKEAPSPESLKEKKTSTSKVETWLSDSVSQASYHLGSSQDTSEVSVVEGSASKWDVLTRDGKTIKFDFFSEVRRAVLDGRISPGDFIVPFEGTKYPIEQYPGTADLFGNQYSKTQVGLREIPEWKPISRGSRLYLENALYTILLLVILGSLYFAYPYAIEYWKAHKGEALLEQLAADPSRASASIDAQSLEKRIVNALRRPDIIELVNLVDETCAALAKNQKNTTYLGYLSQLYSEIGYLKHDDAYFEKAELLAFLLKKRNPADESYVSSHARYFWRTGKPNEGITLLLAHEPLSSENSFIMGNFYMQAGDTTKAVLYFSDAYSKVPSNLDYLFALVDYYEKDSKYKEAAGFVEKALDLSPESAELQARLVSIYKKSKDYPSLEDYYRNAIALGKNAESNSIELIHTLQEQRKHNDVVRETSAFLSKFPNSPRVSEVSTIQRSTQEQLEQELQNQQKEPPKGPRPRSRLRPSTKG